MNALPAQSTYASKQNEQTTKLKTSKVYERK